AGGTRHRQRVQALPTAAGQHRGREQRGGQSLRAMAGHDPSPFGAIIPGRPPPGSVVAKAGRIQSSLKVNSLGRAEAPTNRFSPSGAKLYCRFLTIGARYWTHHLADSSAPRREAACTAPQMKSIGLAKLLIISAPLRALCAGWYTLARLAI